MDRIYFVDNPWPNGHRISHFMWSAHFKYGEANECRNRAGLYFDLHLETADYDEDDLQVEEVDEEEVDWYSKVVWNNYQRCTMSSQEWNNKGFRVGSDEAPFDLEALNGKEYAVDFIAEGEEVNFDEGMAFDVYLLGHDGTGFHQIKFTKVAGQRYQIAWKGKLAHIYIGDFKFRYDFHTLISSAPFNGITIPDELTDLEANELLARFVTNPSLFTLQQEHGERKFVFKD